MLPIPVPERMLISKTGISRKLGEQPMMAMAGEMPACSRMHKTMVMAYTTCLLIRATSARAGPGARFAT